MKLFDLTGKVAIVTGGNSGIGLGIASGLAEAGAAVHIVARNREQTESAVERIRSRGGDAYATIADATDPASVETMVEEVVGLHGRLDILVNNAGGIIRKCPEDHSIEEWHRMIEWCLSSAYYCLMAAYPHFKKAGRGKILNPNYSPRP